jgi:ABC-2 type transport system permease protein
MITFSGTQLAFGASLGRLVLIIGYLAVGFAALGAIGLFVSVLTEQPIAATVATVLINVVMFVCDTIPQLDWLHPWLLTHWWTAFGDLLRDPMAFDTVGRGLLTALAYAIVFWLAAWARFAGKDVSS